MLRPKRNTFCNVTFYKVVQSYKKCLMLHVMLHAKLLISKVKTVLLQCYVKKTVRGVICTRKGITNGEAISLPLQALRRFIYIY